MTKKMTRSKDKRKTTDTINGEQDNSKTCCNERDDSNDKNARTNVNRETTQETNADKMEDNLINENNSKPHNTEWWRKDNGQWRCDNEKPDNKDKLFRSDTFGFSNIYKGAIKVVAALDTDKSTRDATKTANQLCA